jgi:hypothetical protein
MVLFTTISFDFGPIAWLRACIMPFIHHATPTTYTLSWLEFLNTLVFHCLSSFLLSWMPLLNALA